MKNIHVLDLNDGKIQMRHGEEVPSDFTFLYFKILLFREKATKKTWAEGKNKLMATAAQGRTFWL